MNIMIVDKKKMFDEVLGLFARCKARDHCICIYKQKKKKVPSYEKENKKPS